MLRTIFFDFGGTLMSGPSDRRAHWHSWQDLRRRHRLRTPLARLARRFEDLSWAAGMEERWVSARRRAEGAFQLLFFQDRGEFPTASELRWFWQNHLRRHREHTRLLPGTHAGLHALRALGFELGIISDIDDEFLAHQLRCLDLDGVFDTITTSEEVGVAKPNPRIFAVALGKAQCRAGEAAYVGDSVRRDVLGAVRLGMSAVYIGLRTSRHADHSIRALPELVRLFEPGTRSLEFVLAVQVRLHGPLAPPDLYKMIFQATMGSGHWHPSRHELARAWHQASAGDPAPVLERIDPAARVFRLNIGPFKRAGGTLDELVRIRAASVRHVIPRRASFRRLWRELGRLAARRRVPVRTRDLAAFERAVPVRDLPVLHHSPRYLRRERPAYILVARPLLWF